MIADGLMAGFYSGSGVEIGISVLGYLFIPAAQGGFVMQDTNGVNWLLTIGTDGALSTQPIVFP